MSVDTRRGEHRLNVLTNCISLLFALSFARSASAKAAGICIHTSHSLLRDWTFGPITRRQKRSLEIVISSFFSGDRKIEQLFRMNACLGLVSFKTRIK